MQKIFRKMENLEREWRSSYNGDPSAGQRGTRGTSTTVLAYAMAGQFSDSLVLMMMYAQYPSCSRRSSTLINTRGPATVYKTARFSSLPFGGVVQRWPPCSSRSSIGSH